MNCPEAREAFSDLYDGRLAGQPLAALSEHLDDCPGCRAEWVAFRRATRALKDLGGAEPSPDFAARVAERIEAPRRWRRVAAAVVLPLRVKIPIHAAALVVLGLAGLWVFQRSPELQRATVRDAPPAAERAEPAREAAPPVVPPGAAPTTEADESPAAPSPRTARPKSASPGTGARTFEGPPAAATRGDTAQEAPAQEKAAQPATAPPATMRPQAQGEVGSSGGLQSVLPPPDARAKAESTPRAESGVSARQRSTAGPGRGSADAQFSSAVTEFAARRYDSAIGDLRAFLAEHPGDARAPDARFLLADAYRAQGRYAEAGAEFEAFLRQFPQHPRAPAALYRQGEVRLLLGDHSGCGVLRDALNRYPDAREAAAAREALSARCP